MSEPPWEKMYRELEERHVALAQKVVATAAFLDRMAERMDHVPDPDWNDLTSAVTAIEVATACAATDCRAEAQKLRGET